MTCRLALERSKAPIAILLNNASSALERGGASNTPTICWPCGSIVETAAGTPIGQRAAKTCRTPQMKTAQLRHENRQRECITLDRTPQVPIKLQEHYGVTVAESTIQRIALGHAKTIFETSQVSP